MRRRRLEKGDAVEPANRLIRAACCGHPAIPLDMMTDLRTLSRSDRAALTRIPEGVEFACDACIHSAHDLGQLSHTELAEALGAPPAILALWREHEKDYPYPPATRAHRRKLHHHPHQEPDP
jgi:hypothetical protein